MPRETSRKNLVALPIVLALIAACAAPPAPEETDGAFPTLTGAYLGQQPPGMEPELFAPGIVSTGLAERDMAITPDGTELYFAAVVGGNHNYSAILVTRLVDGHWTPPEVAPFSGQYMDLEPAISADGRRLFFMSNRPQPGATEPVGNEDIWVMDRADEGWTEPYNLGPPVNTESAEFFPSLTHDGTIYFTRRGEGRVEAIYRSRWVDGAYVEAERLPEQVNSGRTQFNAFIAPDESYIIVSVFGREDTLGGVDYYVVFRSPDDAWSEPINMGERINTGQRGEWSASVSPDGKVLFFMSSRAELQDRHAPRRLRYDEMREMHDRPMNGNSDIWWVDAAIIEALRPEGF